MAMIHGTASWDDGYAAITAAITKIKTEVEKAGLKINGRPITVFLETSDDNFTYDAMVPIEAIPAGKDKLTAEIRLGKSPPGKAIKFQHRAAYEEIDSTYEAITAYLDEKGLEAQNLFIEEYINDVKSPEDPTLEVNIYVFVQ